MNKAFRSHFNHFGILLGKIFLFHPPPPPPSKTDGRVPSQQGAPTTFNLTDWEVFSRRMSRASLGVVIGQNSVLQ